MKIANVSQTISGTGLHVVGSGSSGYTEEEKRVLEHTSKINDNIFVPFMSADLKDKFVFPIPYSDKVLNLFEIKINAEKQNLI